jgi:putative peptidoglycan lipid II flippase
MSGTSVDQSRQTNRPERSGRAAFLVASGILLSRLAGLVRDRVFAHYLGSSDAADAFRAALRIPNILQNLFGEGVLSASFIPVYARLLGGGEDEMADRVAGVIGALLSVLMAVLVLMGVLAAPVLIDLIAPGFTGDKRSLTILLVQILFPGIGALVLSAWCLGILNSHGRFFLSYAAPVVWNLFIIAGLVLFHSVPSLSQLVFYAAWASVVGSVAQLVVQLPTVFNVAPRIRFSLALGLAPVRNVISSFFPVFISRGVVQLSAYIDSLLASLLPSGAVALLTYAQTIALLPISLFGMSISAAELPAMSRALAGQSEEVYTQLRDRLNRAMRRLSFFVIPSAVGFLIFGDTMAALIYQSGRFTHSDAIYVWSLLAGSGVGLVASTSGRLCSSAFYALRDTRTPLIFALIRVFLTTALGYFFAFPLPRLLGIDPRWGMAGLTASAGIAGWIEFLLLQAGLRRWLAPFVPGSELWLRLWAAALIAAGFTYPLKLSSLGHQPLLGGLIILPIFGALYLALTLLFRVPEARTFWRRKAR